MVLVRGVDVAVDVDMLLTLVVVRGSRGVGGGVGRSAGGGSAGGGSAAAGSRGSSTPGGTSPAGTVATG